MKVYVVMMGEMYQGADPLGVSASEEGANAIAGDAMKAHGNMRWEAKESEYSVAYWVGDDGYQMVWIELMEVVP